MHERGTGLSAICISACAANMKHPRSNDDRTNLAAEASIGLLKTRASSNSVSFVYTGRSK